MATTGRWYRELAVLAATAACVVVSASCGGDGESSAEDGLPAGSEATVQPAGQEPAPPRPDVDDPDVDDPDVDDPVVDEGLEGMGEDPGMDTTGVEGEELAEDSTPEVPGSIRIPAGTRINAAPDEDISTAEYRIDDPVIVRVVRDVLGSHGELLLPRGVRLLGRVRTSIGSGGPRESAVLEIDFETLSADRYERPIEGAIVNRPVILDPVATRRRQSAPGRERTMAVVPGLIMGGTIIVVELRAPVDVPPWGDSLMLRGDSVVRPDTTTPGDRG